jgi:hypothetical protein
MPVPKQQLFSANGQPLVGGKLYTYAAGTNNPKATFTDSAGTVQQQNPIPLNSRGEPDSPIYWSGSYKVELRDALGNLIYTVDNFNTDPGGLQRLFDPSGSTLLQFLQRGDAPVARTVASKLQESISVKDFGAVGDGETNDTDAFTRARNATGGVYLIPNGTYVLNAVPNVFADPFIAGDNVVLVIGGSSYTVSNAFCGALRYRVDSPVLTSIVHAKTGNVLMQFQDGEGGTATYFYRGLSIQTDSHWCQAGPKTVGGSVDLLYQRSASHPTDAGGNRFNETFEETPDRMLFSYATTASGAPNFDTWVRVYAGVSPKIDFPALAPCFRQGWSMQNRAETGFKLVWTIGTDRHHIQADGGGVTHMTFKADGSVGFFGAGGITRPSITGSRGGNAALASLLTQLNLMGLIADGTTA